MSTRPPNQASGSGSTGTVKGKVKPKSKGGGSGRSVPGGKSWNGGPAVHSISQAAHDANVAARRQLGTTDLTAPPTGAQAIREANAAADLQYGPQVTAAQQMMTNVAPWFQQHLARVAGYANAARAQMQPTLDQAQALAAPASNPQLAQAQVPQGLDPNSEAGRASAMAAQGRAALAALGAQALGANAQGTQDYFSGVQATASRELPQAQQYAGQQLANAQSQRGQAVTKFLTDARANAQNYAIARGTLGLNTEKAAADVASDTARQTETVRHNTATEADKAQARKDAAAAKGQTVNKYGYTNEQWQRFSAEHRRRIIEASSKSGSNTAADKEAKKHADAITKASGGVQNTVQDIIDGYNSYRGKTTDDTSKPKDPKTGQYPPRPLTDADIRAILGQNKAFTPQLIHIALMRRQGKKLGKAEVNYLHNLDPNIRIPRDWLDTSRGINNRRGTAPSRDQQPG